MLLLLCLDLRRGGEERENLFDCCRQSVWAREGEDVFGESEIVNVQVESEFKNIWRETLDSGNFESLPRFDSASTSFHSPTCGLTCASIPHHNAR